MQICEDVKLAGVANAYYPNTQAVKSALKNAL
jgi:hypothetical protein